MRPCLSTKYVSGKAGDAVLAAATSPGPSCTFGYVSLYLRMNERASPGEVLGVDADDDHALTAPLLPGGLEPRRLRLHGAHHEAQKFSTTTLPRREASRSLPGASSRGRSNYGCRRRPPLVELAGGALALVHHLPDQEAEETRDGRDRERLQADLQPWRPYGNYAGTM